LPSKLAAAGFLPMRKLLLVGPPGVGKTMTASVLATSLDVPLLRVNLHAVIGSHLGETSGHLAKIFEHIRATRAVYLFDEFDALAGARGGRETDVGEMRRVVNSLLQFIELDDSPSLLIAATNHSELIDGAMFRRFDDVIELGLPTHEERILLVRRGVTKFAVAPIDWDAVSDAAAGVGHADLVAASLRACKDAILGYAEISTASLLSAVADRVAGVPVREVSP
jgi:SpoVK/Ycf46/Vps4 family AAA+-type ATPase